MLLTIASAVALSLLQQAPAEGTDWDAEFGVKVKERATCARPTPKWG